jgi:uncharacterized protein YxeA
MTKGAKIGIVIAVIIVVGVGGYFLYTTLTDSSSDGSDENDNSVDEDAPPINTPPVSNPPSSQNYEPTPFKNQGQGDYFRLWVNRFYPKDAKAIDLSKTGAIDNNFIRKAWLKYGLLYKQQVKNWDKITNKIPSSFVDKFGKKDSYNFQINSSGNISLIPKISGEKIAFNSNGLWFYGSKIGNMGSWWDNGKQANYEVDGKKTNVKSTNFFELAKKLQAMAKKDNFSSFADKNNFSYFDDNYGL